jgi:hypothetical protein
MATKLCPSCKERKPANLAYFGHRKDGHNGLSVRCRTCWATVNAEKTKKFRRRRPDYIHLKKRKALEDKYGLPYGTLDRIEEEQKGRCKICRLERKLHADHDHETGKFRGMICHKCNSILGYVGDNPHFLRRAALYLEEKL